MSQILVKAAAALFALVLLAAALGKFDAWGRWTNTAYTLVPRSRSLARKVRVVIPIAEVSVGVLLVVRPTLGLFACAVLLAVFAGAVALLSRTHAGEDCACFGAVLPSRIGIGLAVRNFILAAAAAGVASMSIVLEGSVQESLSPLEIFVALFVGVIVAMAMEFLRTFDARALLTRRKVTEA